MPLCETALRLSRERYEQAVENPRSKTTPKIMSQNIINHISIIEAINELTMIGKNEIVIKLQYILNNNEILKPDMHNRKSDKLTSYYKIDLAKEDLDEIRDLFLDLEVGSLTDEGEATQTTERYVSLLNNWLTISPNNSASS